MVLRKAERGSASVQAVLGISFLMLLSLGVVQVALTLYARNVVISSAHEGARAAVELGRTSAEGEFIARRTLATAAGRAARGLDVSASVVDRDGVVTSRVRVRGALRVLGPLPIPIPIDTVATVTRNGVQR